MTKVSDYGITVESLFIPFSKSRHRETAMPNLNWRVTVKLNGREVITTDYSAGMAHCPSYGYKDKGAAYWECENGYKAKPTFSMGLHIPNRRFPIKPDPDDVVSCLLLDSDVINYSGFEDWCSWNGYDDDSISHKAIYDACLSTALKLRAGLGETLIETLREALEDH